jgi:hypothetical protein
MVKQDVPVLFPFQNCSKGNSGRFLKAYDFLPDLTKKSKVHQYKKYHHHYLNDQKCCIQGERKNGDGGTTA